MAMVTLPQPEPGDTLGDGGCGLGAGAGRVAGEVHLVLDARGGRGRGGGGAAGAGLVGGGGIAEAGGDLAAALAFGLGAEVDGVADDGGVPRGGDLGPPPARAPLPP